MKRLNPSLVVASIALVAAVGGSAIAGPSAHQSRGGTTTRAFSLRGSTNSRTTTLLRDVHGLTVKASCDGSRKPVITATTSAQHAALLGRVVDARGKVKTIFDDAFTTNSHVDLTATVGRETEPDASASVNYMRDNGKVVTLNYSFDAAPTLNGEIVCIVYGTTTSN